MRAPSCLRGGNYSAGVLITKFCSFSRALIWVGGGYSTLGGYSVIYGMMVANAVCKALHYHKKNHFVVSQLYGWAQKMKENYNLVI